MDPVSAKYIGAGLAAIGMGIAARFMSTLTPLSSFFFTRTFDMYVM
mgnify:CR=1 FL=1